MPKRQLAILLFISFMAFFFGSSLVTLVPVFAGELGADSAQSGWIMAFAFFWMAVSTIIAGRLSDRLGRRKELLLAGTILTLPTTWLMGQATTPTQLTLFMVMGWFVAGFVVTSLNILVGLFAPEGERGRIFGFVALAGGFGGLAGGLFSGPVVDRWGYPTLFTLLTLLYIAVPVAVLFLKDKVTTPPQRTDSTAKSEGVFANRAFLLLFLASILVFVANSEIILGRSLIMADLRFDATAISGAGAVGSLVTLPLPLLVGWLSDRLGRKPFLIILYLLNGIGLIILALAFDLWHFWAASALQVTVVSTLVVGSAMVTDMFPKETLGASLSLLSATSWIGNVVGFGATGSAMLAIGTTPALILGALLTLVAVLLISPPRLLRLIPPPSSDFSPIAK
jgi:MFS family permease